MVARARSHAHVRLAEPRDLAALTRIHVSSWHATYRDLIAPHNLARIEPVRTLARFRRHFWLRDDAILQVLDDADAGVIGYAYSGGSRELGMAGEVHELYLDPAQLRRGHGRTLLSAALWSLAATRRTPAFVWVLSENWAARRFYEHMRGVEIGRAHTRVGDQLLAKTAYAWIDYLPWPG